MHSEPDDYDGQFSALCAAFDRAYTPERRTAYRAAFVGKLSAAQVARAVERLIGEGGPDRMPTVSQIWEAHKAARARAPYRGPSGHGALQEPPQAPPWVLAARRMLIRCAWLHPGKDARQGWQLADRLGAQFQALADDGDPQQPAQLQSALLAEYSKLSQGVNVWHS